MGFRPNKRIVAKNCFGNSPSTLAASAGNGLPANWFIGVN